MLLNARKEDISDPAFFGEFRGVLIFFLSLE
jgi:hypothetical protein